MLLWVVYVAVVVLSVAVLGALVHGVLGARARLVREVTALEREVRPLLDRAASTARGGSGPGRA